MTEYYVKCENHGIIGGPYSEDEAYEKLNEYLSNEPGPHGNVKVIERYARMRHGLQEIRVRYHRRGTN